MTLEKHLRVRIGNASINILDERRWTLTVTEFGIAVLSPRPWDGFTCEDWPAFAKATGLRDLFYEPYAGLFWRLGEIARLEDVHRDEIRNALGIYRQLENPSADYLAMLEWLHGSVSWAVNVCPHPGLEVLVL
jgi:hypothetical protein